MYNFALVAILQQQKPKGGMINKEKRAVNYMMYVVIYIPINVVEAAQWAQGLLGPKTNKTVQNGLKRNQK